MALGALLACYMAQQGSDPMHENHLKKTPIDINKDPRVDLLFKQFVQPRYCKIIGSIKKALAVGIMQFKCMFPIDIKIMKFDN